MSSLVEIFLVTLLKSHGVFLTCDMWGGLENLVIVSKLQLQLQAICDNIRDIGYIAER